jgi:type I restriction enzyme S subunit
MSECQTELLGQLATSRRGITYSESALRDNPDDGLPYINMKSFLKDGGYNRYGLKYYAGFHTAADITKSDDLLIANTDVTRDGDIIGVPALLPAELLSNGVLFSHHVTRLGVGTRLSVEYLYYLLCTDEYRRAMKKYARGTTVLMLDMNGIKRIPIRYLASHAEQFRVVAVLKAIDTAIEKTEALIAKYQQIKVGLMHDLFTRGVLPDGQLRPPRSETPELYQETVIGWIPRAWRFTTCAKVCEKIIDCKNRTPPETPDGFPVIRTPNVRHGEFVDAELLYTDEHSYLIWTLRGKPLVGDVVITREAPVGEVCMIPERHTAACLGQRMMLYRPNQDLIAPKYFLYALQSRQIQNRLDLISGGSTVGHVRVGDIRDLWMFMPASPVEQNQIASALDGISEKVACELTQLGKLRSQKLGLMQDLLTGKVPVQVDEPEAAHA